MSWLDVAQAWVDNCAEDVKAGRKLAPGSKVRVLAVARRTPDFLVGKVGRVEFYYMTGALGSVWFEDKVTREYTWNPSGEICVQTKFAVDRWEPVPDDMPIGPEEHKKVALEWGCPICWGVQHMGDAHHRAAAERRKSGEKPPPCPRHPGVATLLVVPMLDWHARLMEDGYPLCYDRERFGIPPLRKKLP